MVQLLWHICCRPRPGNYELQSSVTLSRSSPQTATKKKIRGGGHILWLSGYHEHTHVHICITTPGRRLFTCQVKGLKSVTDGDLIRKAGPGVENEYAERLQWEGLEQKLKREWQYSVEGGGFGGGDCRGGGGHRVMRGLNATNAMSQGLIKTSSALLRRSRHTQMHLCVVRPVWMDGAGKRCRV